jgi:hypothetical protein
MSQRIRRSLAVGLLTALSLALPAPSQAAGLWDPAAPTGWVARAWSWLESLVPGKPAAEPRRSAAHREKSGEATPPGGTSTLTTTTLPAPQGSGIDPNGGK